MEPVRIEVTFPDAPSGDGNEAAEGLLGEVRQDTDLRMVLDLDRTRVARTDAEAQDFGASLVLVLGTPAFIILARTLKAWVERTGTSTLEFNGVRVTNLRSEDVAAIAEALKEHATPLSK